MGKMTGFMEFERLEEGYKPVQERVKNYKEFVIGLDDAQANKQAARCMDCGTPFCNSGCPVNNIIPDFNDLVYKGDWKNAIDVLHSTNNFPEFTGRICPAPCEAACTLNVNDDAVGIKSIEHAIIDRAWSEGWVTPQVPKTKTGKKIAVVGSGPAGLAAAQQLARVGHAVTLFEKNDRVGGLLRYGIPDFKMEKHHIDARVAQMEQEGVVFRCGVMIGELPKDSKVTNWAKETITPTQLQQDFDAVLLTGGAEQSRDLPVPGRELDGVMQAMDFLPPANRVALGQAVEGQVTAQGKHVVVIGGGDTGADCIGTAHRQGALSVTSLEIMPQPGAERAAHQPWPTYPMTFRVASAHEEGGDRVYAVSTSEIVGDADGKVAGLRLQEVLMGESGFEKVQGSEREVPAQLVLLAMGFLGPQQELLDQLGVDRDERTNAARDSSYMTNVQFCKEQFDQLNGVASHLLKSHLELLSFIKTKCKD